MVEKQLGATKKSATRIRFEESENEEIETDDDLANNNHDTAEHETRHEGLDCTVDRESLGPAKRAESSPAQKTGKGSLGVRVDLQSEFSKLADWKANNFLCFGGSGHSFRTFGNCQHTVQFFQIL